MANYLVTGGAGFIGSHLAGRLVELGHRVRILDNLSTGKRENLAEFAGRVDLVEGDLRDARACDRACRDIEVVFHQAAVPSVPTSVERPAETHDANINGTFHLLLAAKNAGCRRVIYAASSSAYGDSPVSPKQERLPPDPLSPYAVQKLTGELYARAFYECYGLQTLSLRYFNVFGPRQDPTSHYAAAIPAFVTAIHENRSPTVYGDGEQTRDFTYIDNILHANLLAAEVAGTAGQSVNIACGYAVSLNAIIGRINELLGKNVRPDYAPPRKGDVRHSLADLTLAQQLLGYQPIVSFDEGLARAIDYYTSAGR